MARFEHFYNHPERGADSVHLFRLKKSSKKEGALEPRSWRLVGGPDKSYCYIIMKCPGHKCGTVTELAFFENQERHRLGHYIADNGRVMPCTACPKCRQHHYVKLSGWDPKLVEPKRKRKARKKKAKKKVAAKPKRKVTKKKKKAKK